MDDLTRELHGHPEWPRWEKCRAPLPTDGEEYNRVVQMREDRRLARAIRAYRSLTSDRRGTSARETSRETLRAIA